MVYQVIDDHDIEHIVVIKPNGDIFAQNDYEINIHITNLCDFLNIAHGDIAHLYNTVKDENTLIREAGREFFMSSRWMYSDETQYYYKSIMEDNLRELDIN